MARIKKILLVFFGMLCIPLILPFLYVALYFMLGGVSYLQGANLAPDNPALRTKYVYTFDNGKVVTIQDDHSKIVRSWGGSPDSISIEKGVRTVKFSDGAILKTAVDSIDPQPDRTKVKGYMGIWTDDTEFVVDQNGEIDSTEWAN